MLCELQEHLCSIGITGAVSSLPVAGTGDIRIALTTDDPVGKIVLSKMECTDLFLELNRTCQEINEVCLFGYDEFLDMLSPKEESDHDRYHFYSKYETVLPSTSTGLKYILEEVVRYRTTMENYENACRIEEEEDEWER